MLIIWNSHRICYVSAQLTQHSQFLHIRIIIFNLIFLFCFHVHRDTRLGMKQIIVLFSLALVSAQAQAIKNLKLVSEWKDLEYAFPSPSHRQAAIQSGQYITGRGVPIDVDVDYRDQGASRIFVTIPRFTTGIPVTFGVVTSAGANGGPIIQPYPDYDSQSSHGQNCNGITSVFRVAVRILPNSIAPLPSQEL